MAPIKQSHKNSEKMCHAWRVSTPLPDMKTLSALLLVLAAVCSLAYGQKTDKCFYSQGFKHCGDNKCCCKQDRAFCKGFGKTLEYIPSLPPNITQLFFFNNSLPELNQETFKNISQTNIVLLSLKYNEIQNVSVDAFSEFTNIRLLSLNGNNNIDQGELSLSFGSIPKTKEISLNLEKIGINELPDDFFDNLSNSNVTKIRLDRNNMKILNMKPFQPLKHLQSLSVRKNIIREMTDGVGHSSLEDLDLSKNEIARKPPAFCLESETVYLFPNLKHLDLRGNYISELAGRTWNCLYRLQFLGLSGNVIRNIETDTFRYLHNIHKLQLSNMHGSIQYIGKYAFNNSRLQEIYLDKNAIVFKAPSDIFKGCNNVKKLDLSHNNFIHLNSQDFTEMLSPMRNLEALTLVSGKLNKLPNDFLHTFPKLQKINLDGNSIETLKNVFIHAGNVTKLSLQGNNIHVVDQESLPVSLIRSIWYLNLALNPLECTCEMLWFRDKIGDSGRIANLQLQNWPSKYVCATPTSKGGRLFIDYRPTSLGCKNVLLISIITFVSVLILGLVMSMFSYKYRWYLAYCFYKFKAKRKRNMSEDRPLLAVDPQRFHGYVIYESADSRFVRNDLHQLMEVTNDFRLHVWDRDAVPGSSKLEAVADGIYASDCVIAVISKTAIRDSWIKFQLDVATDRQVELQRDFLILVIMENTEFKLLSKYWCVMFARMPCVRWCENKEDVRRTVFEQQLVQHCSTARHRSVQ